MSLWAVMYGGQNLPRTLKIEGKVISDTPQNLFYIRTQLEKLSGEHRSIMDINQREMQWSVLSTSY